MASANPSDKASDRTANGVSEVVGIDLGTTMCAAAVLDPAGEPRCLPLDGDRVLLRSAIGLGERVLVGERACRDGAGVQLEAFKRDMGAAHFHRQVRGHWVPTEVLSALLLEEIRGRVDVQVGARRAVITVPAYFDERRRKATLEAGRLAGLDVIDIVNEPVAAAIAELDHEARRGDAIGHDGVENVVVYDLGGGTFDVSVLRVAGADVSTLATDGDVRLGGRDFDQRIVDYVADRFVERHGVDPRDDFSQLGSMLRMAEAAKHRLSRDANATLACDFAGQRMTVDMSREVFVALIEPLLERTLATATDAVEQAGLEWGQVGRVLLVGGSSRIPVVVEKVRRETGIEPVLSHEPDLAVARGAAIFAGLVASSDSSRLRVINVNAHSLGVAGVDPRTGEGVNRVIIPRNSRLPATKRQRFVTKSAGQKTIKVKIVEGENENPEYCVPVGTCVATLAPDLPARTEVIVTCRLGTNGTLSVSCLVPATEESAHIEIRRDGLLDLESLEVWRDRLLGRGDEQATDLDNSPAGLPVAPPVVVNSSADAPAAVRRIDYLCQEAAADFATDDTPAEARPALEQLSSVELEYNALQQVLTEARREQAAEADATKRVALQASAASIRAQLDEAEHLLVYARVAFGGACLAATTDVDHEDAADEVADLRSALAGLP